MSDFWTTDTPTREDEAFELLQFGAIQVNDDSEYPVAIARTERRMLNCARFYTKRVAALESEVAALREAVDEYALGDDRYEFVRRLNPRQFAELYQRNISENIPFDELVDAARKEQSK